MAKVKIKESKTSYVFGKDLPTGTLCEVMLGDHKGKVVIITWYKKLVCLSTGDTWDNANSLHLRVLESHEIVELSNE